MNMTIKNLLLQRDVLLKKIMLDSLVHEDQKLVLYKDISNLLGTIHMIFDNRVPIMKVGTRIMIQVHSGSKGQVIIHGKLATITLLQPIHTNVSDFPVRIGQYHYSYNQLDCVDMRVTIHVNSKIMIDNKNLLVTYSFQVSILRPFKATLYSGTYLFNNKNRFRLTTQNVILFSTINQYY